MDAKLMRSETDRMLAGVCGGLAIYLGVDSVFVRLAFLLLIFAGGIGLPLYLVLALIVPSESSITARDQETVEKSVDEAGNVTRTPVSQPRQHPHGPIIAAVMLILLGAYFLLQNFGFSILGNGLIWPLMLIALGIYLIVRRRRNV